MFPFRSIDSRSLILVPLTLCLSLAKGDLVINEFAASNESFEDGDGNTPDWIEIYNDSSSPLDLVGYHLTDDPTLPLKWTFPTGSLIGANAHLIVFASGQEGDQAGNLHANFSLSTDGEYLALIEPDGSTIVQEFAPLYPEQKTGVSYSLSGFFETPTPGATNPSTVFAGFIADTQFSVDRGFYDASFNLEITSETPAVEIYYTTDGTIPSASNGTLYSQPVLIDTTSIIRAIALKTGFIPTNVDTQTYLFIEDVRRQSNAPENTTTTWAGRTADYEMDPQIVFGRSYNPVVIEALQAVPSLSLVMPPDDFYGAQGIYQNPTQSGTAWERATSAELISPDGSESGFQVDAGIRVQGGSSRNADIPKHSFSLRFRETYGPGKLDYPLFKDSPHGESAVEKFDYLQLRAISNYGWIHRHFGQARHAQYNRDQFANDVMFALGSESTHGRWVNLYINGVYWGIYHVHERPDDNHAANYFGGNDDDYDAINSNTATSGTITAYNAMRSAAANSNITTTAGYEAFQEHLNVDGLIDYMIMNGFVGSLDWDYQNWRAVGQGPGGLPFQIFAWDTEVSIAPEGPGRVANPLPLSDSLNINVTTRDSQLGPTSVHRDLMANADYRLRFADRVQAAMFNGGPLSTEGATEIWRTRSDLMDTLIVAESARWGDFRRDVDSASWSSAAFDLYTRDEHYLPDQEWIIDTYLVQRPDIVLDQFKALNLYPDVDPPAFSQSLSTLTLSNPNATGTVHFTSDGTDPRDPSAQVYATPITVTTSATYQARVLENGTWSALQTTEVLVGVQADTTNLAISEIHYNPPGAEESDEFIELLNFSSAQIDLGNVFFSSGISYTFPLGTTLDAGARLVLTPADYVGALANGGESIELTAADGSIIESFEYLDDFPWANAADGDGYSLVRIAPASDPSLATTWRASADLGGNPGATDSTDFASSGAATLLDYALGEVPLFIDPSTNELILVRRGASDDVIIIVESCNDLASWAPFSEIIDETAPSNGFITQTFAPPTEKKQFYRVRVIER